MDGVLDKLQVKIDEMSQEAEQLTDTQSNKSALEGNKDLDKAKEAIKVSAWCIMFFLKKKRRYYYEHYYDRSYFNRFKISNPKQHNPNPWYKKSHKMLNHSIMQNDTWHTQLQYLNDFKCW